MEQVAALWMRCFRHAETPAPESLKRYFVDVLLDNPWFDAELAPLVLEHRGEVAGFIGRMCRPMLFRGRPIRCAVATQLMVDPERKLGFAALELVRAMQGGPQDLCYSDGANDASQRIWERGGGQASRLLSFEWKRSLRPMQSFALRLGEHGPMAALARVTLGTFDACSVRLLPRFYHKPQQKLSREPADARLILPLLQQVSSRAALSPVYTIESYDWILRTAAQAQAFGPLRSVVVRDADKTPIGWFVYFVQRNRVARVLQAGATYGRGKSVLSELLRDAWEQDAAVVTGQLDPLLLTELSNVQCEFSCKSMGVLVHAKDAELLSAFNAGDAFLSRLEGEWWMRFGIDRAGWK